MSVMIAGDNGTELIVTVMDDAGVVDLTTATKVEAYFIRGDFSTFSKTLTIIDAEAGKCSATLSSGDLSASGTYTFQVTITFSGGNSFSCDWHKFLVGGLLRAKNGDG